MFIRRSITAILAIASTLQLASTSFAAVVPSDTAASQSAEAAKPVGAQRQAAPGTEGATPTDKTKTVTETQKKFDKLVDEFFTSAFRWSPTWATDVGIHEYDGKISTYNKESLVKHVEELKGFNKRFEQLDPAQLDKTSRLDREILISDINAGLLELEGVQNWKHNPDMYSSYASSSVFTLMRRKFASPEVRLKYVTEREKQIPELFANAKKNLEQTPKIYTEVALEQIPGIISFFKDDVPKAFADVKDQSLQADFQKTNTNVVAELESYQKFLKDEVLPKSVDNFAIGKENYQKKILYEEMVSEPVDSLLTKGMDELHRLQNEFNATAHLIDPTKKSREVYAAVSSEHPQPDKLIDSVSGILNSLREKSSTVVTIPTNDKLAVEETPPFMRATTFASMDAPGAFEKVDRQAYYQVTLPEKSWDAKKTEEHMRFFCTRDLINTSVHEAYPGHFVQGLWTLQAPSKTRKLLYCSSNAEGWAHYCEQMMVDEEGLGAQDPKLKLVQLHDALLRACRYIVGIRMHCDGMTMDQAKDFFVTEGYQEPANAERETKRGTMDPTYLVYTLGKMQILSLRDDYKKKMGDKYSLKAFNDAFLAEGGAPIKVVREAMLETN